MTERIVYFDMLRGLAIIFVIVIHSSNIGLQFPDTSINFHFTVLLRQVINIAVPLFLAISGYFLAKKNISNLDEYIKFIKIQIPKIYIPFFVFSALWFILGVLIFNHSITKELINLITFQSSGPYYFIALIIQYYILLPILKRLANFKGVVFSFIISLITIGIIFYIRNYMGINLPLILYAGNFPIFLVFFILGLYIGTLKKIQISNKLLLSLIICFYFLSCIESYTLYAIFENAGLASTAMKPSSFIFSMTLIVYFFKNINLFKSNILRYLGEMSFGIYLMHMFILIIISRLIIFFYPSLMEIQPLYQLILSLIIILMCFLIIFISKKILPKKIYNILGFK